MDKSRKDIFDPQKLREYWSGIGQAEEGRRKVEPDLPRPLQVWQLFCTKMESEIPGQLAALRPLLEELEAMLKSRYLPESEKEGSEEIGEEGSPEEKIPFDDEAFRALLIDVEDLLDSGFMARRKI